MRLVKTNALEITVEEGGHAEGAPVMILHGWPDAPRGWSAVRERLEVEGWRTFMPYLRGTQPTRFFLSDTPRDGSGVALVSDAARAAYIMAGLFPQRITAVAGLSLAFQPRGEFKVPEFAQSRRLPWPGLAGNYVECISVAMDRRGNGGRALRHPAAAPRQLEEIHVPTLIIQGRSDFCDPPSESEAQERYFKRGYRRIVLEGVGHFPHREAAGDVADALLAFLPVD